MKNTIAKITTATLFAAASIVFVVPANAQLANGNTYRSAIPAPGTKHSNPNSDSNTAVGDSPAGDNMTLDHTLNPGTSDQPSTPATRQRLADTDSTNATMPGSSGNPVPGPNE